MSTLKILLEYGTWGPHFREIIEVGRMTGKYPLIDFYSITQPLISRNQIENIKKTGTPRSNWRKFK
jgi:hypothetical protein